MDNQLVKSKGQTVAPKLEFKIMSCVLGEHRDSIIKILAELVRQYITAKIPFEENDQDYSLYESGLELTISQHSKRLIEDAFGGNWITICGRRFSISLPLIKGDFYAHFEFAGFNLMIARPAASN